MPGGGVRIIGKIMGKTRKEVKMTLCARRGCFLSVVLLLLCGASQAAEPPEEKPVKIRGRICKPLSGE